jgi:hypothetical protein
MDILNNGENSPLDNWVEDFVVLGFRSFLLSAFERISRSLFEEFGHEIIYEIMENETIGVILILLLPRPFENEVEN